jgi:hypothetical protein
VRGLVAEQFGDAACASLPAQSLDTRRSFDEAGDVASVVGASASKRIPTSRPSTRTTLACTSTGSSRGPP